MRTQRQSVPAMGTLMGQVVPHLVLRMAHRKVHGLSKDTCSSIVGASIALFAQICFTNKIDHPCPPLPNWHDLLRNQSMP